MSHSENQDIIDALILLSKGIYPNHSYEQVSMVIQNLNKRLVVKEEDIVSLEEAKKEKNG